jgi:hypothetical protein
VEKLFSQFGYYYERREDLQVIIKGMNKISYSEPQESREEFEDCEGEAQTINHHTKVS